ncbi:MAG: hypothetical protein GX303_07355 [Clostridiales bacterium]|nr:hypothetical protein [Clostridiales bacterium]
MKNDDNKEARYCVQIGFTIRCYIKGANIFLPSGDSGLFSPFLEIKVKKGSN